MDVMQDDASMLPKGDFEKLNKHEKEEFHALQERAVQHLLQVSNHFRMQFPHLHIEWRFQAEVYQDTEVKPMSVRYSNRIY